MKPYGENESRTHGCPIHGTDCSVCEDANIRGRKNRGELQAQRKKARAAGKNLERELLESWEEEE